MWQVVARVLIRKFTAQGPTTAEMTVTFNVPAGQIPGRDELRRIAREQAAEQLADIRETMGNQPYDYGSPIRARIVGVVWVP